MTGFIFRKHPIAPTSRVFPSMIIASSVVSPSSSGLPRTHCSITLQLLTHCAPFFYSIQSCAPSDRTCHALVLACVKPQVFITIMSWPLGSEETADNNPMSRKSHPSSTNTAPPCTLR
eukprot:TRINITY_DN32071_c0_g1_i1.p1 TRINITY_DN32071_c0_g1~~TRINITY_DN32071_c0_g1_i1.p1  ORF type:complete len:118 (+),score=14.36 TRINITY_DN32071_c0_g1_i1:122-475(+)